MNRLFDDLFELLHTRLREIENERETFSSEIEGAELIGRAKEICVVLDCLRPYLEKKLNAKLAKEARAQGLLH
jgi:hypothetical protein